MRHVLHEFLWLVRRRRVMLIVQALLWATLTAAAWNYAELFGVARLSAILHFALLFMAGALALEAGDAVPAAGTTSFWRTRPPRWHSVLFAHVCYVVVCLAGPAMVCWVVNGLLLDQTGSQWLEGMMTPAMLIAALLVLVALSSLASVWLRGLGVILICGSFVAAGVSLQWLLEEHLTGRESPFSGFPGPLTDPWLFFFVASLAPAAGMMLIWAAGLRRTLNRGVIVAAGLWLILAPPLIWLAVRRLGVRELTIAATVPGDASSADVRVAGLLKISGVPEGSEIALLEDLSATWLGLPPSWGDRDEAYLDWYGVGYGLSMYSWRSAYFSTPRAGSWLRSQFSGGTRWYSNEPVTEDLQYWRLYDWEWQGPLQARLNGTAKGRLIAAGSCFSVQLEAGAEAARDGTHLRIVEVKPGERNLRIHLELRHAYYSFFSERDPAPHVFVLHLPELSAALLRSGEGWMDFQAPQFSGARGFLDISMPDAELAAGARWTSEVLRGAELWHFAPGEDTPYIAIPEEGIVTLYPPEDR
jgi:hypothetical protein